MKRILITGASEGIGKEFAYSFGSRGFDLILVARNIDKLNVLKRQLEEDYQINVDIIQSDLSIKEEIKKVYDYCKEEHLDVGVLVNNAGFGDYNAFMDADIDKLLKMIDLNNKALITLTYYFINDMKDNSYGHIINVGSVASFFPGPYMAVYYATKAFVLSFSLALREELKQYNIKVSTLCPGPTKSNFWQVAGEEKMNNNLFSRNSKQVAETGYSLYEDNKAYRIDGLLFKISTLILRILPPEKASKIMAYIQLKNKENIKEEEIINN